MVRKQPSKVYGPDHPTSLQDLIEAHAALSVDIRVKYILAVKKVRDVQLVATAACVPFELRTQMQRIATLAYSVGRVVSIPCALCASHLGQSPFPECVVLDGMLEGQCMNCVYRCSFSRTKNCCSHSTEEMILATRAWNKKHRRKSAADEYVPRVITSKPRTPQRDGHSEASISCAQLSSSIPNRVHLIGALELQHPSAAGLDENVVDHILDLIPHLQMLHGRDLRDLSDRLDPQQAFDGFKVAEQRAWENLGYKPDEHSTLVQPSGSIDSPIAHRLNQPSYSTAFQLSDETADCSNGCIAMVKGNGIDDDSLIFDHIARRCMISEGIDQYPPEVLRVHEDWSTRISASSAAKVELQYGKKVQRRILKTMRCSILPLWGEFAKILLVLVHESNFHNANSRYRFRKVVLFATHPQRLFYEAVDSPTAVLQDLMLKVADLIADRKDGFDRMWHQAKKWRAVVPSAHAMGKRLAERLQLEHWTSLQDTIRPNSSTESPLKNQDVKDWESFFTLKAHSDQHSRTLLPRAIASVENSMVNDPDIWYHPSQLPQPVFDWFTGQKDVIFYHCQILGPEDIANVLDNAIRNNDNIQDIHVDDTARHDLRYTLHALMHIQQNHLASNVMSNQDLTFTRIDGSAIEVVCECGELHMMDEKPRFSTLRKNNYVMRQMGRCLSAACGYRRKVQFLHPVLNTLQGVANDRSSLLAEKLGPQQAIGPMFLPALRKELDLESTKASVVCWCVFCKEDSQFVSSRVNASGNQYTDRQPRWTLGMVRPLYIPRDCFCHKCLGGRLVPVDHSVPFLVSATMRSIWKSFNQYHEDILATILDSWPSSSHESKVKLPQSYKGLALSRQQRAGRVVRGAYQYKNWFA